MAYFLLKSCPYCMLSIMTILAIARTLKILGLLTMRQRAQKNQLKQEVNSRKLGMYEKHVVFL